jgi:hypothetical protein
MSQQASDPTAAATAAAAEDPEAMFIKALEADPHHVSTLYNYGLLLKARGDDDGAEVH